MLRSFLTFATFLTSTHAMADASSFASVVTEKIAAVRSPIDFFVVNAANQRDVGLEQVYRTDALSVYRGYTFSPKNATVNVTEFSDARIALSIIYQNNFVFKADSSKAGFDFASFFDADVECVFTSTFVWNCHFIEVLQDFEHERIWPNPISGHSREIVTRMGPNASYFQKSVLEIVQDLAENY